MALSWQQITETHGSSTGTKSYRKRVVLNKSKNSIILHILKMNSILSIEIKKIYYYIILFRLKQITTCKSQEPLTIPRVPDQQAGNLGNFCIIIPRI